MIPNWQNFRIYFSWFARVFWNFFYL